MPSSDSSSLKTSGPWWLLEALGSLAVAAYLFGTRDTVSGTTRRHPRAAAVVMAWFVVHIYRPLLRGVE